MQFRHDEDISRAAEPAEWIELVHQALVEGDVGAHLAVIFEADAAPVEQRHGIAYALAVSAHWIAEIRIRQ